VIRTLLERLRSGHRGTWREVLPYQPATRLALPALGTPGDLWAALRPGADFRRTAGTVYLTPEGLARSALATIAADYPPGVGVKVFLPAAARGDRELLLTAGLLHLHDVGARVYDLAHLRAGGETARALVVEHLEECRPGEGEWALLGRRLGRLGDAGLVRPRPPAGWDDGAFRLPDAVPGVDASGRLRCDPLEHLTLGEYEPFLEHVAVATTGDRRPLGAGGTAERYLHQSVPGVRLPARRSVEGRVAVIRELLRAVGVSLAGRLVLDIGCNVGLAMADYLHLGARWCHGWDLPVVVPQAERLLLALGCTRFSTTPGRIAAAQPVETDLPAFLRPALAGAVVSYLAIRAHVGWLEALARIPWAALIYEGHRTEDRSALDRNLAALGRSVLFTRGPVAPVLDGRAGREHLMTVLVREGNL
jgi:hypothetical protein